MSIKSLNDSIMGNKKNFVSFFSGKCGSVSAVVISFSAAFQHGNVEQQRRHKVLLLYRPFSINSKVIFCISLNQKMHIGK
jgi:hypothetical protein